jgi:hypothetical protein
VKNNAAKVGPATPEAASLDTAQRGKLVTREDYLGLAKAENDLKFGQKRAQGQLTEVAAIRADKSSGAKARLAGHRIHASFISRPLASRPMDANAASANATTTTVMASTVR